MSHCDWFITSRDCLIGCAGCSCVAFAVIGGGRGVKHNQHTTTSWSHRRSQTLCNCIVTKTWYSLQMQKHTEYNTNSSCSVKDTLQPVTLRWNGMNRIETYYLIWCCFYWKYLYPVLKLKLFAKKTIFIKLFGFIYKPNVSQFLSVMFVGFCKYCFPKNKMACNFDLRSTYHIFLNFDSPFPSFF